MIRFAYPNVDASEQFIGCGRYMTTTLDAPTLSEGHTIAEPNVGHLSKVTTAASLLAKESFETEQEIYEYKDQPDTPYLGDSMGLAYLLALIHRSRRTCWERNETSFDIWCTGTIEVAGGVPMLNNVYRNLFSVKLQAFLMDQNAPLFIVPVANLEPKHRQLCRPLNVSILSLDQYSPAQLSPETKAILQLHGHELNKLVQTIFLAPPDDTNIGAPTSLSASMTAIPGNSSSDFDLFLAYAKEDKPFITHLVEYVTHAGLKVWWDEEQISIGDQIGEKIEQGLQKSRFVLLCLSRYFSDSVWGRPKCAALLIRETKTRNPNVLPVIVGEHQEEDVPEYLYDKYVVDIRDDDGLERLMRKIRITPKAQIAQNSTESEHNMIPQQLDVGIKQLQNQLFRFSKQNEINDDIIVEVDNAGGQLLDLLEAFPDYFDVFHEVISEYQSCAEKIFHSLENLEYRRVLNRHFRRLEQCIEDLAGGFQYGESFLTPANAESSIDSPYSLYPLKWDEFETDYGVKMLISDDELQESEGIDWLLKSGFDQAEKHFQRITDRDRLNQVLHILWKRFPRVLLYYRETFWELAKYMLHHEPLKWKLRFHAMRILLKRSLTAAQASNILQTFVPEDQHVLSAFLALHHKSECRALALEILPKENRWDIVLYPGVPWLLIRELVEKSCHETSDSYIKALFLLLRPRLLRVDSPLSIGQAYRITREFYHVPVFLQETFFQALIALHKQLNAKAQDYPITRELEHEMSREFQAFCAKGRLKDVDITEMRHIPPPIQRKLAHDGYLPRFFICNIRDVIALETVPHVEHRQDVIKFLRLRRINARALEKLASNKHLMREHQNRSAFCYNPKANSVFVRTYLSTLTRREIKDISRNRNVSTYARELANKYLSRYT